MGWGKERKKVREKSGVDEMNWVGSERGRRKKVK